MPQLVTVKVLGQHGIPKGTAYRMAKEGLVPSYRVGPKKSGVRFIVEEVLTALRQGGREENK